MTTIIQAKFEHLNQIYAAVLELARHEDMRDKVKITESQLGELLFCTNPGHFAGVTLAGEKVVGLILFNYTENNVCFNVGCGMYIETLYVAPGYRNQGIGRDLFKYAVCQARNNHCSRLEWWVSSDNQHAINFYNKLGAVALTKWQIFQCELN